jgi:hypothetical protein
MQSNRLIFRLSLPKKIAILSWVPKKDSERHPREKHSLKVKEDNLMADAPPPSVYLHFRFKFLAITTIAFLLWVILGGSREFSEFSQSQEFQMIGPFLAISLGLYFLFRKFPIKCPGCQKVLPTHKDWLCPDCGKSQGRRRCLVDKCVHCKQILATSCCEHCGKEFRL